MAQHKGRTARIIGKNFFILLLLLGCARVNIQTKEPIKLDVKMRVDIYQHVSKDADAIEDMISGPGQEAQGMVVSASGFWGLGIGVAYAQEETGLPADVQAAVDRRRNRRAELVSYEAQGILGEGFDGLLFVRKKEGTAAAKALAQEENRDRRTIYIHIAQKNGVTFQETADIFAKRIQADAPAGTPIETAPGVWKNK